MPISQEMLIYIAGAILAILALTVFSRRESRVMGLKKGILGFLLLIGAAFLIAGQMGYLAQLGLPFAVGDVSNGASPANQGGPAFFQPSATYTARDTFADTFVSGTAYYKVGNAAATTTAYTNVNSGDSVTYWVSNTTTYVTPTTKVVGTGVNAFIAPSFVNGTATITGYDLVNRQSIGSGTYNTSMGANKQASEEITYQGTSKKSSAPFGGVMVVEYNSTISSVTCTGPDLLSSNPYTLTYVVNETGSTYSKFAFGPSLDDGTGSVRRINCQFQNSATGLEAGARAYIQFYAANYYISTDGRILLDVEKAANQDTTKTQVTNQRRLAFFFGS